MPANVCSGDVSRTTGSESLEQSSEIGMGRSTARRVVPVWGRIGTGANIHVAAVGQSSAERGAENGAVRIGRPSGAIASEGNGESA
jgi:hypothetical protein